ncbi:ABC transporter permease [Pseudoflavonifractor phocaeensis]|uniref:ABC transporter permease n=1 Tax=Pseudoflavonifractor phocaeensis TaxID=1870988 RepID=UPI0019569F8C|nr:ABC transporter permease [Pseudoflavonifractor phocaeensis]MBM6870024.1 ABC transporter permease [Pseudoflavonifractor phocaeensis]
MNLSQSFRLALKSLATSKMRALLTMLGIIIGVAAVIIITSLGNGMQQMMNNEFEKLGANLIQVQVYGIGMDSRSVDPEDMYALARQYPAYLSGVTPSVSAQAVVRVGSQEYEKTGITGVSEDYINMSGETVAQGRYLRYVDVDRAKNVCVIGAYLSQEAFGGGGVGETVTLSGVPYTVVGVLSPLSSQSSQGSSDDRIYIPYTSALRLNNTAMVSGYLFTCPGKDSSATAKAIIENRLYETFQSSDYYFVMTSAEMMDAMNTMMNTMMVVLVAIAAISLLVGGIGIMNIMLVSVTERTREIGIRKSLGAKRANIRTQFIIEAGTTSAIGGVLGILLGVGLAGVTGVLISSLAGPGTTFTAVPAADSVLTAFGVSVGIGVFFGYMPADKAAKLNPIDALRYE